VREFRRGARLFCGSDMNGSLFNGSKNI
jgi:hypothetical protein